MNDFKIRKINVDKEKIVNCVSCDEPSTSMQIEEMFEITLFYFLKKLYICDCCKEKLKNSL